MHIGIDAFEANIKDKVGMGNYADNLIRAIADIDTQHSYSLYLRRPRRTEFEVGKENFHYVSLRSFSPRTFWTQCRLPLELFCSRPHVLHIPAGQKIPWYRPCPTIVTIHDLAFLKFKDYFQRGVRWRSTFFTEHAARHADRIIAISQATKNDIIEAYHINEQRVDVIYHGVGKEFRPVEKNARVDSIKAKYAIQYPYVLFIGVLQPRKNISRLIRAFSRILPRYQGKLQLVIAGNKGWLYEDIFRTVRACNIEDRVVFTGYVPKGEVMLLLNGACLFVLPSLYEGFGMPLLEAMACGTPVITSNISSMPEVVGEAGLLCDPYDEDAIAGRMNDVLAHGTLRDELSRKGLQRAKCFSWKRAAEKTKALYETMGQTGSRVK